MSTTVPTLGLLQGPELNQPLGRGATLRAAGSSPQFRLFLERPWTFIIAIGAIALWLMHAIAPIDTEMLELTRHGLRGGRLWTVFTGPLLHVSFEHLLFDVLGLLVVGCAFEPMFTRGFPILAPIVSVAVAIAAFAVYPDVAIYRGLSALDQGLLAGGAAALASHRRYRAALIIAAVLLIKWSGELVCVSSLMAWVSSDPAHYGESVPWCHAIGGLAGAASTAAWLKMAMRSAPAARPSRPGTPCASGDAAT